MTQPQDPWQPQGMAERIMLIRRRRGMSQAALARAVTGLGVSVQEPTISSYETGRRRPAFGHLWAIAVVLDVGVSDLGATEEEYPELRLFRDPEVVQHIRCLVNKRRDLRKLAPVQP